MESKLLRIELQSSSREKLKSQIAYMKQNPAYPKNEMEQKGYFWDSVFLEESEGKLFLYMVLKSKDFSSIMLDEIDLKETPFKEIYNAFQVDCWMDGPYKDIEEIFCFNESMTFIE